MSKEAEVLLAKLTEIAVPARNMLPPHDSMVVSDCQILYERVSDGKQITVTEYLVWNDDYGELNLSTYIWSEGNFSCTCNRGNFFDMACGIPEKEIPDYKCGYGEYLIEIKDWSGKIIYSEFSHHKEKES